MSKKVKNFPLPDLPEVREDDKIPTGELMIYNKRGVNWKLTEKQLSRWLVREVAMGRMSPAIAAVTAVDMLPAMKKDWYKRLRAMRKNWSKELQAIRK